MCVNGQISSLCGAAGERFPEVMLQQPHYWACIDFFLCFYLLACKGLQVHKQMTVHNSAILLLRED